MGSMAKYVEIMFGHRLRFLILLVILPAELVIACIFLFPHQTAISSLWVDTPAYFNVSASATGWNQYLTPAQNTVDALDQLRRTDAFVKSLGDDLAASNTFRDSSERASVMSTVTSDVRIQTTGSHLVLMTYTCPRQSVCINVLTATVRIYQQWLADRQLAQAKIAIDFYSNQLADSQATLQADTTALNRYVAEHPGLKPTDAPLIPEFDQLIRSVDQDRIEVAALQQKLDGIKLTDAAVTEINGTVLKVIDPPRTVGGEISSLPRKQMAMAGIAAWALAAAVLVIMAWSDRTVRERRDLEHRLRIPVVSTIPDLASGGAVSG